MTNTDPRVDEYIEKAEPFARPILKHLRKLIHQANPGVQETIKWGMPFFDYRGPYCHIAAFKQHAVFSFWKSNLLNDPDKYLGERAAQGGEAMGNFGRICSIDDLPPEGVILEFLLQAKILNDQGIKVPAKKKGSNTEFDIPDYFLEALRSGHRALENFENFPPSAKKDYIQWITETKTEKTRLRRLQMAVEWIEEGKKRNWKYEK